MGQQYDLTLLDTIDWYGPKSEIRQDNKQVGRLLKWLDLADVRTATGLAYAVKGPADNGPKD